MRNRTMEDYLERLHQQNDRLRTENEVMTAARDGWEKTAMEGAAIIFSLTESNKAMHIALAKAIRDYGQPGGPWNVPSEPGTWLHMAKQALGVIDHG